MRLLYLVANGFAATLDWVMGMFIVWALGQWWPYELTWYHYVLGAFLGLAPDFDFIHRVFVVKKGEGLTDHHDSLMHRPALMLPLAAILGYLIGGNFWAVAAPVPIFAHYVHDTRGLGGGGIGWLWPFSCKHYGLSSKGLLVTEPREAAELWPDHNRWLEEEYLRPSRRAVLELVLASWMLAIVARGIVGEDWIVLAVNLTAWVVAVILWLVSSKEVR